MQDRFKFRVWCKECKEWEKDQVAITNKENYIIIFLNQNFTRVTNIDPVQHEINFCTGLKDKNGKLIYGGDFFASKICPQCHEIVEFYCDELGTNEWCLNEVIGEVWMYAEVYELLKQIKHPSKYVLGCIEDYIELQKERLLNANI